MILNCMTLSFAEPMPGRPRVRDMIPPKKFIPENSLMRLLLSLIGFVALSASGAMAQAAAPACDGDITIVSVYQIKSGGTMTGFLAAVAANQAWYRTNGINDNQIVASRVIVKDDATGGTKFSDTDVLTYHVHPPNDERTPEMGDSDWKQFEKLYDANADKKAEYTTCMPRLGR